MALFHADGVHVIIGSNWAFSTAHFAGWGYVRRCRRSSSTFSLTSSFWCAHAHRAHQASARPAPPLVKVSAMRASGSTRRPPLVFKLRLPCRWRSRCASSSESTSTGLTLTTSEPSHGAFSAAELFTYTLCLRFSVALMTMTAGYV